MSSIQHIYPFMRTRVPYSTIISLNEDIQDDFTLNHICKALSKLLLGINKNNKVKINKIVEYFFIHLHPNSILFITKSIIRYQNLNKRKKIRIKPPKDTKYWLRYKL